MIAGLTDAEWLVEPQQWDLDEGSGALTLVAPPGSDLIHEPLHGVRVTNAPAVVFPVQGDFSLRAKVSLKDVTGKWSAGILLIWQDEEHWAKLCCERDHRGNPAIITVVTNGWSDDAVHWALPKDEHFLRVLRTGDTFVMHASATGREWEFVRTFRLAGDPAATRVGFLTQSPWGTGCTATFSEVLLSAGVPDDVRDGT